MWHHFFCVPTYFCLCLLVTSKKRKNMGKVLMPKEGGGGGGGGGRKQSVISHKKREKENLEICPLRQKKEEKMCLCVCVHLFFCLSYREHRGLMFFLSLFLPKECRATRVATQLPPLNFSRQSGNANLLIKC